MVGIQEGNQISVCLVHATVAGRRYAAIPLRDVPDWSAELGHSLGSDGGPSSTTIISSIGGLG